MTNSSMLKAKIQESGMTITAIAAKCGFTRESLYKKLNGETEFKASEIVKLTNILHLTQRERNEIFLS